MAARQTKAQVNPCIACLAAFFTNVRVGACQPDLVKVRTLAIHIPQLSRVWRLRFRPNMCQFPEVREIAPMILR